MKFDQFKKAVKAEFGKSLEHATPANVREFVDKLQTSLLPDNASNRIVIDEPCNSYEEVIKDFFARVLEMPPEEGIIVLWTVALDLAFASVESQNEERFSSLFREIEDK